MANKYKFVRLTELNNKSRKGTYVYIKPTKGRGKYFKLRSDTRIDAYVAYANRKNKKIKLQTYLDEYEIRDKRRTKRTPISRQADRYIKKIKQKGTITQIIKTGITSTTITNPLKISLKELQKHKKKLLEPLVLDFELLKLLTTEQNFNKLKHRLEYRLTIKGDHNQTVSANIIGETPEKVISKLQTKLKMYTKEEYIEQKLKEIGWNTTGTNTTMKIRKVNLQIIFRKG